MSKNGGLTFSSLNNTEDRSRRSDKSGKKPGPCLQMSVRSASNQKMPFSVDKSKTTPSQDQLLLTSAQSLCSVTQAKSKPSLKDLCTEDKRRIANLVQELARVSEEKEESVQKLRDEQENFEKKIQQLEEQNHLIVEERENSHLLLASQSREVESLKPSPSILSAVLRPLLNFLCLQLQYRECQELLGLYQQYLSQQQEKLNKSITLLNQPCSHSKVPCSDGPTRPSGGRGTALDGSYLDHPTSARETERSGSVQCCHSFPARPSNSFQNGGNHDWHPSHVSNRARSDQSFSNRNPLTFDAPRYGTSEPKCSHQCQRMEINGGSNVKQAPDQENWEEKRRYLLQQKKQLEMERERIQARLAHQEEKLLLQNQQLQQSYLQYSKLQETTTDVDKEVNGESSLTKAPQSSSVVDQVKHSLKPASNLSQEMSVTRKDMATSPVIPSSFQISATPSIPSSPHASRLDDSLIELLDFFSPISNAGSFRMQPSSLRSFTIPPSSVNSLQSPFGPSGSALQDLEESKILEDIFFIC
ncbi:hypothetical protein DNTS_003853 [Danionella cerebrum]|nr:hypothetical protein DNTS_003853 [Danionella translucida]